MTSNEPPASEELRKQKWGGGWKLGGAILITGGTGSLGRAIVRRAERDRWPADITIFSRDEAKQGRMRARHPGCRYVLGDVRDLEALMLALDGQDLVIHAAAHKVVPSAEVNVAECVKTNVLGSMNVATAALRCHVPHVIGISTDKAVLSVNLYGKSKGCMEALFQQAAALGKTRFNLARYGNVVGSNGSIVPLFERQAKAGGPLTVTDLRMNRFWLSLQDAVDLIIQAFHEPGSGTIVVPKIPSMKVVNVAAAVWQAAGWETPAYVQDMGIRPGEKLNEHLLHAVEALHAEDAGEFYRVHPPTSGYQGALPPGFEYRTDNNDLGLSIPGMAKLIADSTVEVGDDV